MGCLYSNTATVTVHPILLTRRNTVLQVGLVTADRSQARESSADEKRPSRCRKLTFEMSTHPVEPSASPGQHLELPIEEQLARAKPWAPAKEPLFDDLSDEEESAFLEAISR